MSGQTFNIVKKRVVFHAVQELVQRKYEVYVSVEKEAEINCVLILEQNRHIDLHIDAHSGSIKTWHRFENIPCEPRDNFYFLFYTEPDNRFYIIPSEDLPKMAKPRSNGNYDFDVYDIGVKILSPYTDRNGFKRLENLRYVL